ncbi:hypothetical protein VNO77_39688 [Canavalia gladiata]|uniref:Uncharacterized protein n=1 Tax=Canavalia gladiata TaxID=3824 RepID=A0AAN9PR68_CANGL
MQKSEKEKWRKHGSRGRKKESGKPRKWLPHVVFEESMVNGMVNDESVDLNKRKTHSNARDEAQPEIGLMSANAMPPCTFIDISKFLVVAYATFENCGKLPKDFHMYRC